MDEASRSVESRMRGNVHVRFGGRERRNGVRATGPPRSAPTLHVPLQRTEAEHRFGFFSQCYERTSLIVTTNLPFADWPQVFAGDERLAGALMDRLTHHVHILEIQGDSYRLAASKQRQPPKGGEP